MFSHWQLPDRCSNCIEVIYFRTRAWARDRCSKCIEIIYFRTRAWARDRCSICIKWFISGRARARDHCSNCIEILYFSTRVMSHTQVVLSTSFISQSKVRFGRFYRHVTFPRISRFPRFSLSLKIKEYCTKSCKDWSFLVLWGSCKLHTWFYPWYFYSSLH